MTVMNDPPKDPVSEVVDQLNVLETIQRRRDAWTSYSLPGLETLEEICNLALIAPDDPNSWVKVSPICRHQPPTARNQFKLRVYQSISSAHRVWQARTAKSLAPQGQIVSLANRLKEQLERERERRAVVDIIEKLEELASDLTQEAQIIKRFKNLPAKFEIGVRRLFVERLLDAAAKSGGRLTLSQAKGEASPLFQAADKLKPYLPTELQKHFAFATLRRTYELVARKNAPLGRAQKREKIMQKNQFLGVGADV